MKVYARSATDQVDFFLGHPIVPVAETTGRGAQLTRTRVALGAVSNTNFCAMPIGHRPRVLLRTRKQAALRCYECEGLGHYARECPTRQKRDGHRPSSPDRRNPNAVRGVRAHLVKSPKTRRKGEAPRKGPVRETSERCER